MYKLIIKCFEYGEGYLVELGTMVCMGGNGGALDLDFHGVGGASFVGGNDDEIESCSNMDYFQIIQNITLKNLFHKLFQYHSQMKQKTAQESFFTQKLS